MANSNLLGKTALISALAGTGLFAFPMGAMAADTLADALKESKTQLMLRPRYENVNQEDLTTDVKNSSDAFTLKTRLTFTTGSFFDTSAVLEFDDVTSLKDEDYNDGAGNGGASPVIADPVGTEVNQAYLSYKGLDKTDFRYGRQRILLDNERFVGGVGWRQNEQTYDSFSVTNTSVPGLTGFLARIYTVHRIFGDDSTANAGLYSMDTNLLNVKYDIPVVGSLTGYYYDLDYLEAAPALSTKTMGLRLSGAAKLDPVTLGYELEYAKQSETGDNPTEFDANYYLISSTITYDVFTFGIAQEVLGADEDAGKSFATPLATLHKFQGWADMFLGTPAAGVQDSYATFKVGLPMNMGLIAMYHSFESDVDTPTGENSYGSEFDVAFTKKFDFGATVMLKYADFSGEEKAAYAGLRNDVTKFWLMATYAI